MQHCQHALIHRVTIADLIIDETSNSDAAESARTGYVASRAVDGSGYGMSDLVRLFLLPLAFRQVKIFYDKLSALQGFTITFMFHSRNLSSFHSCQLSRKTEFKAMT